MLGFEFDGNLGKHTIWLTEDRRTDILTKFKKWIREVEHRKMLFPLKNFEYILKKLRCAFITIPYGKLLLSPCNQMLGKDPENIFLQHNKPLLSAIRDCCHLL